MLNIKIPSSLKRQESRGRSNLFDRSVPQGVLRLPHPPPRGHGSRGGELARQPEEFGGQVPQGHQGRAPVRHCKLVRLDKAEETFLCHSQQRSLQVIIILKLCVIGHYFWHLF